MVVLGPHAVLTYFPSKREAGLAFHHIEKHDTMLNQQGENRLLPERGSCALRSVSAQMDAFRGRLPGAHWIAGECRLQAEAPSRGQILDRRDNLTVARATYRGRVA
jgi:hypothetical protein